MAGNCTCVKLQCCHVLLPQLGLGNGISIHTHTYIHTMENFQIDNTTIQTTIVGK